MIIFTTVQEIRNASLPPPLEMFLERSFVQMLHSFEQLDEVYTPTRDGPFVLVEPAIDYNVLPLPLSLDLREIEFEGVQYDRSSECFFAVYVSNNSWSASLFIPDTTSLDPILRLKLFEHLSSEEIRGFVE